MGTHHVTFLDKKAACEDVVQKKMTMPAALLTLA